jgi:catechol 2,3-dioxygenase-like lactoylglutathione lyase family enzyme
MTQPPRVLWTFHGTAVVRSYRAALDWLGRMLGCRALEYSDNDDPLVARSGGVTWLCDSGLELMEPRSAEGAPARFLARFGPGVYGLALQVEDLDAAARHLRACGAQIVGDLSLGFCFTQPRDTASVYLEWAAKPWTEYDPRFGAALPPPPGTPRIDAPRIACWAALVADPAAAAARLRELWAPAPLLVDEPGAPPDRPAAVIGIPDGALALYRMPPSAAATRALWGCDIPRPRLHAIALRVRDLAAAARTLAEENVRVLRGSAASGELYTDPRDTHGIPLLWTDRDVPGDARGPLTARA